MRRRELPVIAAIPAYNAETTLPSLLNQVLPQGYDSVYVLDDNSTDGTIESVHQEFSERDVVVIPGPENLGPGGNRNRIIPELYGKLAIVHFLDSDVSLESEQSPEIARELGSIANVGFVGGLVRNPDGTQNPYNFGPRPSTLNDLSSAAQYINWMHGNHQPRLARLARTVAHPYLRKWPNIYKEPEAREVFWSSEANMVISSLVFEQTGGYDGRFRYSEIFDYAIRLNRLGFKQLFDPRIDVTHLSVDTADDKMTGRLKAAEQLRRKYGRAQYLIGARAASIFFSSQERPEQG